MRLGYVPCGRREKRRGARFNEAEAHAPRIRGLHAVPEIFRTAASMRPRRMRLGYAASALAFLRRKQLLQ